MTPLPDRLNGLIAGLVAAADSMDAKAEVANVRGIRDLFAELAAEREARIAEMGTASFMARDGGSKVVLDGRPDHLIQHVRSVVAELAATKARLAGLVQNLREVHERILKGIAEHGSEGCEVFATLLSLHNLGPLAIAAAEQGGA